MLDIKRALQNGEVLTGPFSLSGSPTLVETIGYAVFDSVIIDCQHGTISPFGSELEQQIRAAYAADIAPVVRTADNDRGQILKAMDFGAKGVIVPQVNTAEEARQAVSYIHTTLPWADGVPRLLCALQSTVSSSGRNITDAWPRSRCFSC
jgi:2-keto-3-deoxy-L-rhamnonate aldolase RhmA